MTVQDRRDHAAVERAHSVAVLFAGLETCYDPFIGVEACEVQPIRVRRSAAETGREWVEGLLDALLHTANSRERPRRPLCPSLLSLRWSVTPAIVETGSTVMHSHSERVH